MYETTNIGMKHTHTASCRQMQDCMRIWHTVGSTAQTHSKIGQLQSVRPYIRLTVNAVNCIAQA